MRLWQYVRTSYEETLPPVCDERGMPRREPGTAWFDHVTRWLVRQGFLRCSEGDLYRNGRWSWRFWIKGCAGCAERDAVTTTAYGLPLCDPCWVRSGEPP